MTLVDVNTQQHGRRQLTLDVIGLPSTGHMYKHCNHVESVQICEQNTII